MQNILVIGGGTDSACLLDHLYQNERLFIKAVIDEDENAPGLVKARELNIPIASCWEPYITTDLDMVFEMTSNSKVAAEIAKVKCAQTEIMPASFANLLIQLLEENNYVTKRCHSASDKHERLITELDQAKTTIRKLTPTYSFADVYGASKDIELSIAQAKLAADNDMPVLLRGEIGTGKELFAHAIHNDSTRSQERFIRVKCSFMHTTDLEELLFSKNNDNLNLLNRNNSLFEEANKGTLFFDEVADLPMDIQKNMMHFIQEGKAYLSGSNEAIMPSVKIITATAKNLEKAMVEGLFLEELYYALNRITIHIPPLRSRKEDILTIVDHLLEELNDELSMNIQDVSHEAQEWLQQYNWPGNVRELENILSRAMIYMDASQSSLRLVDLRKSLSTATVNKESTIFNGENTLATLMNKHERTILETALHENDENKSEFALQLGISLRSLYYKLEKFNLL